MSSTIVGFLKQQIPRLNYCLNQNVLGEQISYLKSEAILLNLLLYRVLSEPEEESYW